MTTTSLEEMQQRRPGWMPRWMHSVPDAWAAFGSEHQLKAEEYTEGGEVFLRIELPGIDPDRDVTLTLNAGVLEVRGERRLHRDEMDEAGFRTEFTYGQFVRRIDVPSTTKPDNLHATYQDGILEIRLPAADDQGSATRIPVHRS